jgi:hypothetical protein
VNELFGIGAAAPDIGAATTEGVEKPGLVPARATDDD